MPRALQLTRIDRYVLRQLFVGLVLVSTCLVALIWLTQSLRFIQVIVSHGLSPLVFLRLTSLLVPSFLATILPLTCFIVVVFTYAKLAGDRELTVMRTTGLSDTALARPALLLAAAASVICYGLNIVLVPASLSAFRDYEFEIRSQMAAFLLEPGVFTPVAEHVMVYVQGRGGDDSLRGIIIEDNRDPASPATIIARTGQMLVTPSGPQVLLQNGSRQTIDAKTGQLDVLNFERNALSLAQAPVAGTVEATDSSQARMRDLFDPPHKLTPYERGKWLVEAHRRLTAPLAAISFTLIGLAATLRGRFRRHGALARPAGAVVLVVLGVALSLGVSNLAARNLGLIPLIWLAVLLPGVAAAVLLFKPSAVR